VLKILKIGKYFSKLLPKFDIVLFRDTMYIADAASAAAVAIVNAAVTMDNTDNQSINNEITAKKPLHA